MSFSHNPYNHVEFIRKSSMKKNEPDLWHWYCQSCGGESDDARRAHPLEVNLGSFSALVGDFMAHIWTSHNCRPEDFEGWSDI